METSVRIPNQKDEANVTFLNLLLANEYMLYTKTRIAHWNIEGPKYFETHVFLENNYNAIDVIIDETAEQIRSLGHFALVSLKDFLSLKKIRDFNNEFNDSADSPQIFESLISSHESLIQIIQQEIASISTKIKDFDLADFLKRLMMKHENMVRNLKSFISKNNHNACEYGITTQLMDWQD